MTNSADPDQLASSEANWSGSALCAKTRHVAFNKRRVKHFARAHTQKLQMLATVQVAYYTASDKAHFSTKRTVNPHYNVRWTLITMYGEPSLQRQHLFPKTLPLKWICCCTEYLMSRLICKKGLVLFLFPHRTHVHWGNSNKYTKHMFLSKY